ncbi:MAG: DNA polymerase III subunit beta [Candidatus Riflebacteria bacterium HGW-Riflebacteria-2]|jgi:DNA polymerase-3 subunit beta|nr:MAG: DNA polymerase III subunit beta [Candidatus Riflebacteria bacterium HGW-Riflebacteria-2]
MKFRIDKKTLHEAINVVSRAVASKTSRPVLLNLLMTAHDNSLRFVGTDIDIMMISSQPAEIEEQGHFTIPAKLIQEIVSSIPDEEDGRVLFELDNEDTREVLLSCGRSRFHLQVQPADDFPPVPVIDKDEFTSFTVSSALLKQGLKEAGVAVNTEEGNPVQKSVCIDFAAAGMPTLASTDSKRLAVTALHGIEVPESMRKTLIVPSRAIAELVRLLDSNDSIRMGLYKEQLVISTEHFQLISKLVDGKFPDYNRVLPKESSRSLKINRKDFLQALKAVAPISRSNSDLVNFDVSPNETRIWAKAPEKGMAEMFISSELTGEPINISFNINFVLDFVNNITDAQVILEMTTPNYPGMLKTGNPESEFKYVIMPMSY